MVKHCTGGRTQRSPRNRRVITSAPTCLAVTRIWRSIRIPARRDAAVYNGPASPLHQQVSRWRGHGGTRPGNQLPRKRRRRAPNGCRCAMWRTRVPVRHRICSTRVPEIYACSAHLSEESNHTVIQAEIPAPREGSRLAPRSSTARPGRPGEPARQEGRGFPRTACRHHPIVGRSTRPALHRSQVDRPPVRHPPEPVDRNDGLPHRPAGPWR